MGMEKTESKADISSKLVARYMLTGKIVRDMISDLRRDQLSLKESKAGTLRNEMRNLKKLEKKIIRASKASNFHQDGLIENLEQEQKDRLNKLSANEHYYGEKRKSISYGGKVLKDMKRQLKKEIRIALDFERIGTSEQTQHDMSKLVLEMGIGVLVFGIGIVAEAKQIEQIVQLVGGDTHAMGVAGILLGSLTSLVSGVRFGFMKLKRWTQEGEIYEKYTETD